MNHDATSSTPRDTMPWWQVKMVWLVIAGPLAVVVASLVTASIALRGADDILTHGGSSAKAAHSDVPAVQARNHVVSGER